MELLAYLKTLEPAAREAFAVRVGTTANHLNNIAYGARRASAALAAQIAIESGGMVPVHMTRPDDWAVIWDPRLNHLMAMGAIVNQNDAASDDVVAEATNAAAAQVLPIAEARHAA